MIIALFEPQIPENTGNILRTAACFNIEVHIIMPCGFIFNSKRLNRSSMDYLSNVSYQLFPNWTAFKDYNHHKRMVIATTKAQTPYYNFVFTEKDVIIFGNEGSGLPDFVHQEIPDKITIPLNTHMRSLNLSVAAGIISSFALWRLSC